MQVALTGFEKTLPEAKSRFFNKVRVVLFLMASGISTAPAAQPPCADILLASIRARHPARQHAPLDLAQGLAEAIDLRDGSGAQTNLLTLAHGNKTIAKATFSTKNNSVRFDAEVDHDYRGLGVYSYLLGYVIEKNPQIAEINTAMYYPESLNAQLFLKKAFKDRADYLNFISNRNLEKRPPEDLKRYRQRIIQAALGTPAYKARKKNGFSRLTKIILRAVLPENGATNEFDVEMADQLCLAVEKGEALDMDKIALLIKDRSLFDSDGNMAAPSILYQIDGHGVLAALKSDSNLNSLGDYELIPAPIFENEM